MPRSLLLLGLALPVMSFADPESDFVLTINRARADYRKAFAQSLGTSVQITKAEVFLLDATMTGATDISEDPFASPAANSKRFPIKPYGKETRILDSKVLTPEEQKLLLPILRETIAAKETGEQALCHLPIHGVRLWSGDDLIFETSLCWKCNNFYMAYPLERATWCSLTQPALKQIMDQLMPLPQTNLLPHELPPEPLPAKGEFDLRAWTRSVVIPRFLFQGTLSDAITRLMVLSKEHSKDGRQVGGFVLKGAVEVEAKVSLDMRKANALLIIDELCAQTGNKWRFSTGGILILPSKETVK